MNPEEQETISKEEAAKLAAEAIIKRKNFHAAKRQIFDHLNPTIAAVEQLRGLVEIIATTNKLSHDELWKWAVKEFLAE